MKPVFNLIVEAGFIKEIVIFPKKLFYHWNAQTKTDFQEKINYSARNSGPS
jgi:hypothetical protein